MEGAVEYGSKAASDPEWVRQSMTGLVGGWADMGDGWW